MMKKTQKIREAGGLYKLGKKHRDPRTYAWYRQRKKRGFDDRELWNLDHTIAKFTLPRLKRFKEVCGGYPADLTPEQWPKILDDMIYAMQTIADEWEVESATLSKIDYDRVNKGLNLFAKYFRHLWW